MATWASGHDLYIYYFSTWMKSVVQQYYRTRLRRPRHTAPVPVRPDDPGDFNYVYYYWVRVIYFSLLYYSAEYYDRHQDSPQIPQYIYLLGNVSSTYHPLVLCNYGFNGDDQGRVKIRGRKRPRPVRASRNHRGRRGTAQFLHRHVWRLRVRGRVRLLAETAPTAVPATETRRARRQRYPEELRCHQCASGTLHAFSVECGAAERSRRLLDSDRLACEMCRRNSAPGHVAS